MKKSVFIRYFCILGAILFGSFILQTIVLVSFVQSLWYNEKYSLLSNNVQTISEYSTITLNNNYNYKTEMGSTIGAIAKVIGADIYVVDSTGAFQLTSDTESDTFNAHCVDKNIINEAFNGEYVSKDTMNGLFNEDRYTVGYPIQRGDEIVGAVFASIPLGQANDYAANLYRVIFSCSIAVLVLAFIVTYIVTSRVTIPLKQMAVAANEIEKGNYNQHIDVDREDEVGMLAQAFNKMAKSEGSAEQMRRSFISSVSHELKTPMTTMSGFVDGILDGTIPPENQRKYLQIVSDETKRLSRLVNSMLQLSRLENSDVKLNLSQFNVTDMVLQILFSFETRINDKNIEIKGLEDAVNTKLTADLDLIYQVIYNIVENAIKFTPENGYISVEIKREKHNLVRIAVENSGEGLTGQELSLIFERFYKTDRSRSKDKTGMGFGLYIVKMIVGLHNGQVVASSVPGQYTRFDITLPQRSDDREIERS